MLKLDKVGVMIMDFIISVFVLLFTVETAPNLKNTYNKYMQFF